MIYDRKVAVATVFFPLMTSFYGPILRDSSAAASTVCRFVLPKPTAVTASHCMCIQCAGFSAAKPKIAPCLVCGTRSRATWCSQPHTRFSNIEHKMSNTPADIHLQLLLLSDSVVVTWQTKFINLPQTAEQSSNWRFTDQLIYYVSQRHRV